jgi:hypothetical protein
MGQTGRLHRAVSRGDRRFIQCDDYKGYSRVVTLPDGTQRVLVDPERRLGCMMHARRRFHEALKLGDKRAARGVELIASLYEVERAAKEQGCGPEARLAMRVERSWPQLESFDSWVDEMAPRCLPRSPLGEAIGYAKHQHRAGEKVFVDYSRKRPCIVDQLTGEVTEVELFVAVLGASNYTFAEVSHRSLATSSPRTYVHWITSAAYRLCSCPTSSAVSGPVVSRECPYYFTLGHVLVSELVVMTPLART